MKKILIATVTSAAIITLFIFPDAAHSGAAVGLRLCADILIPSLFTFMVLSLFLIKSNALFILEKPLYLLSRSIFRSYSPIGILLSFVGGYPLGAHLIKEEFEAGKIDTPHANARLCYGVNAGPAFIITAVGRCILGSTLIGVIIFVSVTTAAVLNGIIFSRILIKEKPKPTVNIGAPAPLSGAFILSVTQASSSMLIICGYTVFFSVIIHILSLLTQSSGTFEFAAAVLEITNGITVIKNAPVPLIAAAIAFGGISVHCQVLSTLKNIPINLGIFYLSRISQAVLAYIFTRLSLLLPIPVQTIASSENITGFSQSSIPLTLSMMLMSVTLIAWVKKPAEK